MICSQKCSYGFVDYLRRLVWQIHPQAKIITMLAAYLDDSGNEYTHPVVAAGGYIAKVEQLTELEKNWRFLLEREGIREPFRMSQAENLVGPFSGWERTRKDSLISSLIGILKLRIIRPVGCVISVPDFNSVVGREERKKVGGPFSLCAQVCLVLISNWITESRYYSSELIDVFFEKGSSIASKLTETYMSATKYQVLREKHKINAIVALPKDATPLLQPADLVAYETFKYHLHRTREPQRKMRKSLSAFLEGGAEPIGTVLRCKQIEKHLALMRENFSEEFDETNSV